ncbi:MAG TPA: hypothetical protein VMT17_09100 [Anaeromyxobacteraceae bacterium]|nr:hypothetical protein [Anaeromyxobacteraceae bacterium]
MDGPLVRGSHLKEDLKALDSLGPVAAAGIRARMQAASIRTIEESTRIEYLPLAINIEMAEAVHAEAGEAGSRLWARTSLMASLGGLFRPLFEAATALFNPAPPLFYKYIPQGWLLSYKGCGEISVEEPTQGATILTGRGLPHAMFSEAYLVAVCGTFESAFTLTTFEGRADCVVRDRQHGTAVWRVDWRPAARGKP